jgi:hypothetical protein
VKIIRNLLILLAVCANCACVSTMRGTPDRPFPAGYITKEREAEIKASAVALSNGSLDGDDRKTERNQKLSLLLSAVDANYYEFRKDLFANSRHSSASAGTLSLLMTIAGSLTGSPGVKQHYLLGTNLVNGFSTQYQKSYLYEKNIASLIATMDSERALILGEILDSMEKNDYRGQTALLDVYKYFVAGTLENAVTALERDAKGKAAHNEMLVRDRSLRQESNQQKRDQLKQSAKPAQRQE